MIQFLYHDPFFIILFESKTLFFFTYPNNFTYQQQHKIKIFIFNCCCANCQLTLSKYSLWLTYEENDYLSYKDM